MTDIILKPKELKTLIHLWSALMFVWAFTIVVITIVTSKLQSGPT